MSTERDFNRRGSLVLFVAGPGKGSADQRKGADDIMTTIVEAVDPNTDGVVVAGPLASAARRAGEGRPRRRRHRSGRLDRRHAGPDRGSGGHGDGAVGAGAGPTGHYGAVDAADGAMPGAAPDGLDATARVVSERYRGVGW